MSASTMPEHKEGNDEPMCCEEKMVFCTICLQGKMKKDEEIVRCSNCGIVAEVECLRLLIPGLWATPPLVWHCQPCGEELHLRGIKTTEKKELDRGTEKDKSLAACSLCGFVGGFLSRLIRYPLEQSSEGLWVHPFCAYFNPQIVKCKDQDVFYLLSEETIPQNKPAKKARRKNLPKTLFVEKPFRFCEYCKRVSGVLKQCSRCKANSFHVICAYRGFGIFEKEPGKKSYIMLCGECVGKRKAKPLQQEESDLMKDLVSVRRSTRLETQPKRELGPDFITSIECFKEEEIEVEAKRPPIKKSFSLPGKIRSKASFHSKASNILQAIIDNFVEADVLGVFSMQFCAQSIQLSLEELNLLKIRSNDKLTIASRNKDIDFVIDIEGKSCSSNQVLVAASDPIKKLTQLLSSKKIRPSNLGGSYRFECLPEWVKRALPIQIGQSKKSKKAREEKEAKMLEDKKEDLLEKYLNKWITTDQVTNMAVLSFKIQMNYYINFSLFAEDIFHLMRVTRCRCQNDFAVIYVTSMYDLMLRLMNEATVYFNTQSDLDFYELYQNAINGTHLKVKGEWGKKPMPKRQYFSIEQYIPAMEGDTSVFDRMKTKLHGKCDGRHCLTYEELGPLNLADDTWCSRCTDRKKKIECDSQHCGCKGRACKNRLITEQKRKIMGKDVKEIAGWGMDFHTIQIIISIMPRNIAEITTGHWVEEKLNRALQHQGKDGWDIRCSLRYMVNGPDSAFYSPSDKLMAEHLRKVIAHPRMELDAFKVHSKGIGIICIASEGIRRNELIHEYFGEIYPPWRWYEKQDIIKKGQNEGVIRPDLPDFYNIMFERHKYDPDGYDILFVDPISKGSYCSRFSHSCNPNCSTVVMAAGGKYSIGMYALKNIQCGEELTFDYSSFTDNEKEYYAAVCLCTSFNCRGTYLGLANTTTFDEIIQSDHTFLDRIYLIFKAVASPAIPDKYSKLLDQHGIRSALIGKAPRWLKMWVGLILEFIEFETQKLPFRLCEKQPEIYDVLGAEVQAKGVQSIRVQNLAITIDKVMHVLEELQTDEPPFFPLTEKQLLYTQEQQLFN